MNPWPFVTAAYVLTIAGAAAVSLWAYLAMRRAEAAAEEIRAR